jgi:hypothetical protein
MSRQRSLQNGRYGNSSDHSIARSQVGHRRRWTTGRYLQLQQTSLNATSAAVWVARCSMPFHCRNRMLQR